MKVQHVTRMHSSGMRTARLLSVSQHALLRGVCASQHALGREVYPSMHWVGGRGCVYPSMHCPGGVCPVSVCRGVSAWGNVCPGVCVYCGCLPLVLGGVVDTPSLWTEWQTGVKTLPNKDNKEWMRDVLLPSTIYLLYLPDVYVIMMSKDRCESMIIQRQPQSIWYNHSQIQGIKI